MPLATSPSRSGFVPQPALTYDSGAGNGPFGLGWNLLLPRITRKTDRGLPKYHDDDKSDVFIFSGTEDLVPVLTQNAAKQWCLRCRNPELLDQVVYNLERYRPRIEGSFSRIERWTSQADPKDSFWRSISKGNITTWYGRTEESRIIDRDDKRRPKRVRRWY